MPKKKKILIIEDDPSSKKLQTSLLEQAGYEIMVANNAEAGIDLAKEKLPDLIIMDFQLPGMNGELALKILWADERTKNIPVVFVTASVMEDEKKRFASYHCKVITKPIDTRTFVQEIEETLNAPRK
ncbi:MAG: response regulator [Candidatus Omnitrophota bacterium]|jgi:CheY-like chemotaxis protein